MGRSGNRCPAIICFVIAIVLLLEPKMVLAAECRPLTSSELAKMQQLQLPPVVDYSKHVTLVRKQDLGGCGNFSSINILDILKEREYPYSPDGSVFFNSYIYNTKHINQLEVIKQYGSAPEAIYPTNYDIAQYPVMPPAPTTAVLKKAQLYKIEAYTDYICKPTVDQLKRLLVAGPLFAAGDTPDSPPNEHIFTIIGYDDSAQAFKILNSFGDQWGTNGMMKMPYLTYNAHAKAGFVPRVDSVRWIKNQPSHQLEPYTARIHVDHNYSRNNLVVSVGVDGEGPVTVWRRPNRHRVVDDSKGLTFDFALPDYAAQHWPPNGTNQWYVKVQDISGQPASQTVATVQEVTLVQRRAGSLPVFYRPSVAKFSVAGGGTTRIDIPSNLAGTVPYSAHLEALIPGGNVPGQGPASYTGVCPVTIRFMGKVNSPKAGEVKYKFVRSDGGKGQDQTLMFDKAGTKEVETSWRLGRNYSGWVAVEVESPTKFRSNQAKFEVRCTGNP